MEAEELKILVQTESGVFRPRERDSLVSMGSCGCVRFAQGDEGNISSCFMCFMGAKDAGVQGNLRVS